MLKEIASIRANNVIPGDFFLFKFDKINSAKFTNAEIFYNCQNETYILEYIL